MNRPVFLLLIFVLPFTVFGQQAKKVLLIGIDGCRPDALEQANTPNIDALIANGIYSPDALNDDITVSGPGWSAILCGVWSDKHMVTGNLFIGRNYDEYPPIFRYIEDHNPDFNTASICHWAPINSFIVQDHADFKLDVATDEELSVQAVDYITNNDPDFLFLAFDDVDHAGHFEGFSPTVPEYIAAIEGVDAYIGPILEAIENRPNYANEDWLILSTTDHGGIGNLHGGSTLEEERVFVIASGNNIANSLILADGGNYDNTPRITDIPVTALTHLCIPIENDWDLDGVSLISTCTPTGMATGVQLPEVSMFPNPVKNELILNLSEDWLQSEFVLQIHHLAGNKVYEKIYQGREVRLNTSGLKLGMYFMTLLTENESISKCFVKY